MTAQRVLHGGVSLALHALQPGEGARLLLLHELGGSQLEWKAAVDGWPGPVFALDFSGHGDSDWRAGGAYTPELFAADADAALAALGPCRVAGAGLGAYVALLVAGARPTLVPAALLLPGTGLAGGGPLPDVTHCEGFGALVDELRSARRNGSGPYDPMVQSCTTDPRPPDYAGSFARGAQQVLLGDHPGPCPPWWEAVRRVPGVQTVVGDRRAALASLAPVTGR